MPIKAFLQIATIACLYLTGCKKAENIYFPNELQTYPIMDSLPFNSEWLNAEKKLVVA